MPYAVEATAVLEVATPDASGDRIRGALNLHDLSALLGGPAEVRPGTAVVLDVSPTLAVRVREVFEVADVAKDPLFGLPAMVGEALAGMMRGAILHAGRLHLELDADALPALLESKVTLGAPARPIYLLDEPPQSALVFGSQGRLYGIPLSFVSQVIGRTGAFSPMPSPAGPLAGLFPHAQALWPVFSMPGLLGASAEAEPLFLLAEIAGQDVGFCASKVYGVHGDFRPADARGEFSARELSGPALFLDLERVFS